VIVDRSITYACDACATKVTSHDLRSGAPTLWVAYQDVGASAHFCPDCWPSVRLRIRHD